MDSFKNSATTVAPSAYLGQARTHKAQWPYSCAMTATRILCMVLAYPLLAEAAIGIKVASLETAQIKLSRIEIELKASTDAHRYRLVAKLKRAEASGLDARELTLRCDQLYLDATRASCESGQLTLTLDQKPLKACWRGELKTDAQALDFAPDCATPVVVERNAKGIAISAKKLALEPLLHWLPTTLSAGLNGLSGQVDLQLRGERLEQLKGELKIGALGFAAPAFDLTVEGITARCKLKERNADCEIGGGAFLVQSAFVELPVSGSRLNLTQHDGHTEVRFDDPETLQVNASLKGQSSTIEIRQARFPAAYERYISSWAEAQGWPPFKVSGSASGGLAINAGKIDSFSVEGSLAAVDSPKLSARNARVQLDFDRARIGLVSTINIDRLNSGLLELKPSALALVSTADGFELRRTATVDLLGGTLVLKQFKLALINSALAASAGLTLNDIKLAQLTRALGWRAIEGNLNGEIPRLAFSRDVLTTEGTIRISAFDGELLIDRLGLERPFSSAPSLNADLKFSDVDLYALTRSYPIGAIHGRLDGHVLNLRLLNWQPVQFDLLMATQMSAGLERTISQRAVSNLSAIGGGGPAGALQSGFLGLFKKFRYEQMGIGCRLARNICLMDGVRPLGQGYAIVVGAGLPRVDVVGFERRVDFPLLVSRVQAAIGGQAPVIR